MAYKKRYLDSYLSEVYTQFVAIKDDDLKRSREVFKSVFEQVRQKMGEQCNYFKKYSRQVMYGGSIYDGIKISKMDEFDMDIVIRLPINYDDGENGIIIENDQPGYVRLKIIKAFDNLDKQQDWENCHKVTRDWRDGSKYFLQSKFRHWLHGLVQGAMNEMGRKATVNGVVYLLNYKESGPAYTLNVRNVATDKEFKLDVDIVPVIRFMSPRWPKGYRTIAGCNSRDWLVVPKPIKGIADEKVRSRCWRLSFQEYEREKLKDYKNLKMTIRLIKKLRDAMNLKCIASYYIKTLFLWKVEKNDKEFWQNNLTVLFSSMVEDLYNAVKSKSIPYFWNKSNNLIENMKPGIQTVYAEKLKVVVNSIQACDVEKSILALLTPEEISQFKLSEFYVNRAPLINAYPASLQKSMSVACVEDSRDNLLNTQDRNQVDGQQITLLKSMLMKIDTLGQKLESLENRVFKLEKTVKVLSMSNGKNLSVS